MRAGPDHKAYYHELFLRGRPELAQAMNRLISPGKRIPDPKGEPNFYDIAKMYPLPDDPNDVANDTTVQAHGHGEGNPHQNVIAHDTSRPSYARAPPPYDYPDAKRQRQERHSFPPDVSNHHNTGYAPGYAPGYGYPGFSYDYGYGQYPPPPYPHYPHPYPAGPYGDPYGHHHNPYISPERHFSVQGSQYNQQWHPQSHHPYDSRGARPEREDATRAGYEHDAYASTSRKEDTMTENNKHHMSPSELDQSNNAQAKSSHPRNAHVLPPVIHRGSAAQASDGHAANVSDGHHYPRMTRQQYVFPSYGNSYTDRASTGALESTADFENDNSFSNLQEFNDHPAELDERKPAAIESATCAPDLSITPVRNNQRLEWTESFSNEVCDYLLEDEQKSGKKDKEYE
jgi:hypothetical protein